MSVMRELPVKGVSRMILARPAVTVKLPWRKGFIPFQGAGGLAFHAASLAP